MTHRSKIVRAKMRIPKKGFYFQAFGSAEDMWVWTVTAPGDDHPTAFLPNFADAVRYAQTVARRALSEKWGRR